MAQCPGEINHHTWMWNQGWEKEKTEEILEAYPCQNPVKKSA